MLFRHQPTEKVILSIAFSILLLPLIQELSFASWYFLTWGEFPNHIVLFGLHSIVHYLIQGIFFSILITWNIKVSPFQMLDTFVKIVLVYCIGTLLYALFISDYEFKWSMYIPFHLIIYYFHYWGIQKLLNKEKEEVSSLQKISAMAIYIVLISLFSAFDYVLNDLFVGKQLFEKPSVTRVLNFETEPQNDFAIVFGVSEGISLKDNQLYCEFTTKDKFCFVKEEMCWGVLDNTCLIKGKSSYFSARLSKLFSIPYHEIYPNTAWYKCPRFIWVEYYNATQSFDESVRKQIIQGLLLRMYDA